MKLLHSWTATATASDHNDSNSDDIEFLFTTSNDATSTSTNKSVDDGRNSGDGAFKNRLWNRIRTYLNEPYQKTIFCLYESTTK